MSEEYHQLITEYFPEDYNGFFIDVGMSDPITYNNTYLLETLGWNGICIEPNKKYCDNSVGIRKNVINCACGKEDLNDQEFTIINSSFNEEGAISSLKIDERLIESHKHLINFVKKKKVNVRKLDTLLDEFCKNNDSIEKIDFISIDTENTELDVLKGFDIARWKPKLMIIENNFNENFIEDYLKDFGYTKDKRYHINDFYIINI
jgi:FkbM family methyltransferase